MRAAVFEAPGSISVTERPDAVIKEPTDAVVRVVLSCVCGSDLWYYRGDSEFEPGPIGHEFIGVVEEVGADVRTSTTGDFVIAPFAFSDGTCPHCRHGITSACSSGRLFPENGDGGQGEAVRVPLADGTLVSVPGSGHSDERFVRCSRSPTSSAPATTPRSAQTFSRATPSPSSATARSVSRPFSPPSASAPSGSSP